MRNGRVLPVTWDGAGNLPPERSLARALIARGHTVFALAPDVLRAPLEAEGATLVPLEHAADYPSKEPIPAEQEIAHILERPWFARGYADDLLSAVERYRPDLLVVDSSPASALVVARRTGLLYHSLYALTVALVEET
jgi:UDP:flavonoid glycosyltransferase YjiC (YdhE family)